LGEKEKHNLESDQEKKTAGDSHQKRGEKERKKKNAGATRHILGKGKTLARRRRLVARGRRLREKRETDLTGEKKGGKENWEIDRVASP